ncbi:MAG: hypothetical protein COA73_02635 [Candidatus Hydrogenedentota bacterium]|nr:MAG: hypothetical protein COA73_02635 [Candidatus Hydrogenedentota bacterium]
MIIVYYLVKNVAFLLPFDRIRNFRAELGMDRLQENLLSFSVNGGAEDLFPRGGVTGWCGRFHGEMVEWCGGRMWLFRALMLVWFGYIFVRYLANPQYHVLFDGINLGIHELGHFIWAPFGEFMAFLGGSLTQCLAPVISVAVFYRQRDFFGMAFCFGWLSTNLYGVSVYAGDAQAQLLPLVSPSSGEPLHDWFYLLSQTGLLEYDGVISMLIRIGAACAMLVFLVMGSYQVSLMFRLKGVSIPKGMSHTEAAFMDDVMDGNTEDLLK